MAKCMVKKGQYEVLTSLMFPLACFELLVPGSLAKKNALEAL